MADDQALSQQDIQDLQEIASKLPQGHPMVPKISTLLNAAPTQFEQQRSGGKGFWGSLSDRVSNFGKQFTSPQSAVNTVSSLTQLPTVEGVKAGYQRLKNLPAEDAARAQSGRSLAYRTAAGLGTLTGFSDPVASERSADVGDYGAVAGQATAEAAPVALAELGGRVIAPAARRAGTRILRGPGGTADVTVNPATIAQRELEAKVPRNAPPPTPPPKVSVPAQQAAAAKTLAERTAAQEASGKEAAKFGTAANKLEQQYIDSKKLKAIPTSKGPGPYTGPGSGDIGVPGTAAHEAGYTPAVTKVPIRPEPPTPLTPEQVPGPDTPGKGNLLSPAARRGDPRAAMELERRGRRVLFVPAEEYPGRKLEGTLEQRMGLPEKPTLAQRTAQGKGGGYKPSEKAATTAQPRKSLGPEFEAEQRKGLIDRYKGIMNNPNATPEDLSEAQARLRELGML